MCKRRQSNLSKSLHEKFVPDHTSLMSCARLSCFCCVVYFFILKFSLVMSCEFSIMSPDFGASSNPHRGGWLHPQTPTGALPLDPAGRLPSPDSCSTSPLQKSWIHHWRTALFTTPSSVAALTTVMPCYMASQIGNFSDCSLRRTLLQGCYWFAENGAHYADPEVSALVTDSATGDLQAGNSGAQTYRLKCCVERHFASLADCCL